MRTTYSLLCVIRSLIFIRTSTQLVQVALDPPIRQGQTKYPYLVMLFNKEEELDLELNIDP